MTALCKQPFDHTTSSGYNHGMSNWIVYLLRCADNTLYCGITNDIERRLKQHNNGSGAKYTRARKPVSLEACVDVANQSDALKLEIMVKKQKRNNKIEFLKSHK